MMRYIPTKLQNAIFLATSWSPRSLLRRFEANISKKLGSISILLFLFSSFSFATLSIQVDPSKVALGETLTLTIRSDDAQDVSQPTLQPIAADFTVLGNEHQIMYSIINGKTEARNEWRIILLPKRIGHFQLPPLSVGQQKTTETISIEVSDKPSEPGTPDKPLQNNLQQDVFFRTEISPGHAYLHEQVIYTVKVFNCRQLIDVEYTPPSAQDMLIIPLGQDKRYQTTVDNRVFAVEELRYALFPQKSGTINLIPPRLKGLIYDVMPEPMDISGQAQTLSVKPAPTHLDPFLPAQSLSLSESFEPAETDFDQGSTLIRTITLTAKGVPAALLPTPTFEKNGFSVYPGPPKRHNQVDSSGLVGTVTFRITYLFDHAGKIVLPEMQIPWFNTQTQKPETARLSAHSFNIAASSASQQTVETSVPHATTSPASTQLPWILLAVLSALCLLGLGMFFFKRHRSQPQRTTQVQTPAQVTPHLKQACLKNRAKEAQEALLHWARKRWPEEAFLDLAAIARKQSELAPMLEQLNQALYRGNPDAWQGLALWEAIQPHFQERPKKARGSKRVKLPTLRP